MVTVKMRCLGIAYYYLRSKPTVWDGDSFSFATAKPVFSIPVPSPLCGMETLVIHHKFALLPLF